MVQASPVHLVSGEESGPDAGPAGLEERLMKLEQMLPARSQKRTSRGCNANSGGHGNSLFQHYQQSGQEDQNGSDTRNSDHARVGHTAIASSSGIGTERHSHIPKKARESTTSRTTHDSRRDFRKPLAGASTPPPSVPASSFSKPQPSLPVEPSEPPSVNSAKETSPVVISPIPSLADLNSSDLATSDHNTSDSGVKSDQPYILSEDISNLISDNPCRTDLLGCARLNVSNRYSHHDDDSSGLSTTSDPDSDREEEERVNTLDVQPEKAATIPFLNEQAGDHQSHQTIAYTYESQLRPASAEEGFVSQESLLSDDTNDFSRSFVPKGHGDITGYSSPKAVLSDVADKPVVNNLRTGDHSEEAKDTAVDCILQKQLNGIASEKPAVSVEVSAEKSKSVDGVAPDFPRLPPDGDEFPEDLRFEQERPRDLPPLIDPDGTMENNNNNNVTIIPGFTSSRFGERPAAGQKTFYPAVHRAGKKVSPGRKKSIPEKEEANHREPAAQTVDKIMENTIDLLNRNTSDGKHISDTNSKVPDLVPVTDNVQYQKEAECDSVFEESEVVNNNGSRRSSIGSDSGSVATDPKKSYAPPLQSGRKESLVDTLEKKRRESMGARLKGLQIPSKKLLAGTSVTGLPTLTKPQMALPTMPDRRKTLSTLRGFKPPTLKKLDTSDQSNVSKIRFLMEQQAQEQEVQSEVIVKKPPVVLPKPRSHSQSGPPVTLPKPKASLVLQAFGAGQGSAVKKQSQKEENDTKVVSIGDTEGVRPGLTENRNQARNVDGPIREVDGPSQEVDGSSREVDGPARKLEKPIREVDGASRDMKPSQEVDGPTRDVEKPLREVDGLSQEVEKQEALSEPEIVIQASTAALESTPKSVTPGEPEQSLSAEVMTTVMTPVVERHIGAPGDRASPEADKIYSPSNTDAEVVPAPKFSLQFNTPLRQGPKPFKSTVLRGEEPSLAIKSLDERVTIPELELESLEETMLAQPVKLEDLAPVSNQLLEMPVVKVDSAVQESEVCERSTKSEEADRAVFGEGVVQDEHSTFMEDSDASTVIEVTPALGISSAPPLLPLLPAAQAAYAEAADAGDSSDDDDIDIGVVPLLPQSLPPPPLPSDSLTTNSGDSGGNSVVEEMVVAQGVLPAQQGVPVSGKPDQVAASADAVPPAVTSEDRPAAVSMVEVSTASEQLLLAEPVLVAGGRSEADEEEEVVAFEDDVAATPNVPSVVEETEPEVVSHSKPEDVPIPPPASFTDDTVSEPTITEVRTTEVTITDGEVSVESAATTVPAAVVAAVPAVPAAEAVSAGPPPPSPVLEQEIPEPRISKPDVPVQNPQVDIVPEAPVPEVVVVPVQNGSGPTTAHADVPKEAEPPAGGVMPGTPTPAGTSRPGKSYNKYLHSAYSPKPFYKVATTGTANISAPSFSFSTSPSSSTSCAVLAPPVDTRPTTQMEVELHKGAVGLGFCIEGGQNSPLGDRPITVKRLFKGDAAAHGKLQPGDIITSANEKEFSDLTHFTAWSYLKSLPEGSIKLTIQRRV